MRRFWSMVLACALAACSGVVGGHNEYSVQVDRPVDKVYAPFSLLTNYQSPLAELGLPFRRVAMSRPEKDTLLFHIPSSEDPEGSNILMRFVPVENHTKTKLRVSVHGPELLVPDLGKNLEIDEGKIAQAPERAIRNLGRDLERGDPPTQSADEISRLFDVIAVLTNGAVLQRVTGLDRKGIALNRLFMINRDSWNDSQAETPDAARPMNNPDEGTYDASAPTDYTYGE